MLFAAAGTVVLVSSASSRWAWFGTALGVFMYAQAVQRLAVSRHLQRVRQRVGLSRVRVFQLTWAAYIVIGGLVIVGALRTLERTFGVIVAYAGFCWIWIWGWALSRSSEWTEPE